MKDNQLSSQEQKTLLKLVRETIESYLSGTKKDLPEISGALGMRAGAFVTLHKVGMLRGCIGNFGSERPLIETIKEMAISASQKDPRFPPVDMKEMQDIDIEISVLTPLQEIKDVSQIEVGKHGIYITKGFYSGVLLPQVATEQGWDRDTFLSHTCIKAGLPSDAWKKDDLKIEIFEAQIFGEKD
jgi:AmmeMemoRadiSam system protein A